MNIAGEWAGAGAEMDGHSAPRRVPAPSPLSRLCGVHGDVFAERYWGVRPLIVESTDPHGFDDLLDLDGVDELLSRRGLRTPFVRLVRDGSFVESAAFTAPGGVGAEIGDQVRDDKIASLFSQGATIVLQALHRTWSPVIDFVATLGAELGHPAQANAYVTPPDGQGFDAHYDVHDVFVVQLTGTKEWVVHEPVLTDPLRTQPWTGRAEMVAERAREKPAVTRVLRPGEVMYLPRGWLHSATAQSDVSAHLTIGIHVVTNYALAEGIVAALAADPRLRGSLPPAVDLTDPDQLAPHLEKVRGVIHGALDDLDPVAVAGHLRGRLWGGTRAEPVRPVATAMFGRRARSGDAVRLRSGLVHRLTERESAQGVVLELPDRRIDLPACTAPAVRALLSRRTCVVGELPGLDRADQIVLVRRLAREGVIVPVQRDD